MQTFLPKINVTPVTGSGFSQARYKIKSEFFQDLNSKLKTAYNQFGKKLWKGHRLIGIDGSTISLPPSKEIFEHFGVNTNSRNGIHRSLARILFFYDCLNEFVVHDEISTTSVGEKTLLLQGLTKFDSFENDVLIFDRGFGHFNTMVELMNQNKNFCIRFPSSSNFIKSMIAKEGNDFTEVWEPSKKEIENCRGSKVSSDPIKIRVIKILLNTGEVEVLITNLFDEEKYNDDDFKELYNNRWPVEEGFKKLKPKMKLEHFGTRKVEGIFQEYHAHIFCMNLVYLAGLMAEEEIKEKTKTRKLVYKFNWQNAYRHVREQLPDLLSGKSDHYLLLDEIVKKIKSSLISIKPGRSFSRGNRSRHTDKKVCRCYK